MSQAGEIRVNGLMEAGGSEKILIVVAPFYLAAATNLGVAQLKANLERAGHRTEVLYLNLLFAQRIGLRASEYLTTFTSRKTLLGEFVFSAACFGQEVGHVDDYLNEVVAGDDALRFIEREYHEPPATVLTRWREEAVSFCDGEGLEAILDRDAWLVGFSSTLQQNCASLALLERVKRARPQVVTVIGGANCEGEMGEEIIARFPAIDYVGQGECDHALVALVDALAEGKTGYGIPGMRSRAAPLAAMPGRPLTKDDLDDLPYPDYDDFFAQRAALGLDDHSPPEICMETSRGCWWGAKHHCTFCGLNGQSMAFRSKSPRRVLDEIDWLVDQHGPRSIRMTDNTLDMKYFETLLPQLAESPRTALFYETKANLTRDQVRLLAEAGVERIQPGIESLSDKSLRLMRKGVTKVQNVQLLRFCAEYGVRVFWNYLIGVPGENDDEFSEIAGEVESLHHLTPPYALSVLGIHRFSPYFYNPEEYGLAPLTPHKAYRHIYPFPPESLERIAYFFESDLLDQKKHGTGVHDVEVMAKRWRRAHPRSFLIAIARRKSLLIVDTRRCRRRRIHRLTGLRRAVYEYCDRAHGLADITGEFVASATPESIEEAVESLVRDRLILASGGRYLSLGIKSGEARTPVLASTKSTAERRSPPTAALEYGVGRLRSRRKAFRRLGRRLRRHRRRMRNRWTRRAVLGLARLLQQPEQRRDAATQATD